MNMDPGSSVTIQGGVSVTFTIPIVIQIGLGQPQLQEIPVAQPVPERLHKPCPDCNGRGYHQK